MRTRVRAAVLNGGPRDGARVDVDLAAAGGPPPVLPGCCHKPDPQDHRDVRRCFNCGATDTAVDRYHLDEASTNPLTYRWASPWLD